MTKILFICFGNICRSPMAEFVMKDLAEKAGRQADFYVESAATSPCNTGSPVYPPARDTLTRHGVDCAGKKARPMKRDDYGKFDLLIGMDAENIREMWRICGGDPEHKIYSLLDFTDSPGEVADPWYTGDFDATWRDVSRGCRGLMDWLEKEVNSEKKGRERRV